MSDKEFFILSSGKKIYLNEFYNKVGKKDFCLSKDMKLLFDYYSQSNTGSDELNSGQINFIFECFNKKAREDGNNELSISEVMGLMQSQNLNVKPQDVEMFLEQLSDKSKVVEDLSINVVNDVFPELSFLEIGNNSNIDLTKLDFENFKKNFPEPEYTHDEVIREYIKVKKENGDFRIHKFATTHKDGSRWINEHINFSKYPDAEKFSRSQKLIYSDTATIVEEKKGDIVFKHDINSLKYNLPNGGTIEVSFDENNSCTIVSSDRFIRIKDNKIVEAKSKEKDYIFDSRMLSEYKDYKNKVFLSADELTKINNIKNNLASENFNDVDFMSEINSLLVKGEIGPFMDNYYYLTGKELIDDVKRAEIPDKEKTKMLNKICKPYVDSKYFDADKKVESSRVENEYYTSTDEYSIEYNGPIVNLYNKTTSQKYRINLKTFTEDSEVPLIKLNELQSLPGEVLENIVIELNSLKRANKETFGRSVSAIDGFYSSRNIIYLKKYAYAKTLIHELAHAIDHSSLGIEYFTDKDKFKKAYDNFIEKYTSSGQKVFTEPSFWRVLTANPKANYATYNEKEAFAISMEVLMGAREDKFAKWLKENAPELIEASKELYLKIRAKDINERKLN